MKSFFQPNQNQSFFKAEVKPTLNIVLASKSAIKTEAVLNATLQFYKNFQVNIINVETPSGVNEQPINDETQVGVNNRLAGAKILYPNADLYIAIENGLYEMDNRYFDKAIIKLETKAGNFRVTSTDTTEFPSQYVEEARSLGFDTTTVAECMYNAGVINNPKDPHADLGEKISRAELIKDSLNCALPALDAQAGQNLRLVI